MGRRLGVVSSSRSDFGFIKPILRQILGRQNLQLDLIVTGSHVTGDPTGTIREIEADGFAISARVPIGITVTSSLEMSDAIGLCISGFARLFSEDPPDILVVIGDRYEMFGVAVAGVTAGLPVAHISGGDLTEGMLDDSFRHALTKLCHLHFPSNELSGKRILQMGEEPWRVHVVGEPSLDDLENNQWLPNTELAERTGVDISDWQPPLLVTLHPNKPSPTEVSAQVANLTNVLDRYQDLVVITAANADPGGHQINEALRSYADCRPKTRFVESFGWSTYASLMRSGRSMIGNSSSGLLEAPSFELPVVNIGDRQQGRLRAANVIDVNDEPEAIWAGLQQALSDEFRAQLDGLVNPYGDGHAARKIVDVLEKIELGDQIQMKRFQQWV